MPELKAVISIRRKVASIAGADERTAKRWLAGEFEPPAIVIAAIIVEITKRT